MKLIKKYSGEMLIIAGSGVFTYNILKYGYGAARIYSHEVKQLIALGVMLILTGIFIIRNKK